MMQRFGSHGRRRLEVVLSVMFVLLQLVLGGQVSFFGASPGFMLVLAASIAFLDGSRAGCIAGFAAGLLFDLMGSGPVGLSALLLCVAGFVLGWNRRNFFSEGWKAPTLIFAGAALLYNVAYPLFLMLFGFEAGYGWELVGHMAAAFALDLALGVLTFYILSRIAGARQLSGKGLRV